MLLYISYVIPVLCMLATGRKNVAHGPFWLGKLGLLCNIVLILWTLFTLIVYSFPIYMPVEAGSKCFLFPHGLISSSCKIHHKVAENLFKEETNHSDNQP